MFRICSPVCLSVCLSVWLSARFPAVRLPVCLSVSLLCVRACVCAFVRFVRFGCSFVCCSPRAVLSLFICVARAFVLLFDWLCARVRDRVLSPAALAVAAAVSAAVAVAVAVLSALLLLAWFCRCLRLLGALSFGPPAPRARVSLCAPRSLSSVRCAFVCYPCRPFVAPEKKHTHRGARTHDHKVKSLALCRLS